jgi:hypothetical protein
MEQEGRMKLQSYDHEEQITDQESDVETEKQELFDSGLDSLDYEAKIIHPEKLTKIKVIAPEQTTTDLKQPVSPSPKSSPKSHTSSPARPYNPNYNPLQSSANGEFFVFNIKETANSDKILLDVVDQLVKIPRDSFLKDLYSFMDAKARPISKLPSLGYQELDLFKLYCLVVMRGGMDEVLEDSII